MNERIKAKLKPQKKLFNFPSSITTVKIVDNSTIKSLNTRLASKIRQNNIELALSAKEASKFQVR